MRHVSPLNGILAAILLVASGTPMDFAAANGMENGTPTNFGTESETTGTESGTKSGTPTNLDAESRKESGTPTDLVVERELAVRMRDGTILRADVYRPRGDGPFPVLVYRTPYGKLAAAESYETHLEAVRRGYAVVLQDVRGRYASEGEFNPYWNEGKDGYDTIEWAAAQSWSNGSVGTYGLSYPGAVQWLAAIESPPHLRAMAPAMTFSSPRNFFYSNGVFDLSWLSWIYQNVAPDVRVRRQLPGITSADEARRTWPQVAGEYRRWLPLGQLPYLRKEAPFYFEWLKHPPEDPWWNWAELRGRYHRTDAAVLNLSGWFDEAYGPEGAVTNFNGLRAARRAEADPRAHLILGPWTHGVQGTMSRRAGDIDFGPAAAIDYDDVVLDFFDRYLRGRGASSPASAVRFFVMGENRWREATHWPPVDTAVAAMYLGGADDQELRLAPQAASTGDASSSFLADPENPVVDPYESFGPHDYQELATRPDTLTFDTEPFRDDLAVAGPITAIVHASCDCRDFDLWVRIQDVWPDGRAMNVMSPGNDVLRASYREAEAGRQLLEPGKVYELRLPKLITAIRFAKEHRLRVQVSASFAPHFSTNLQTGELETVSATSTPATITIHHDAEYPSRLLLPVLKPRR